MSIKIKVWCDSGANIHSSREETIDVLGEWGITDEEWKDMSDDDRWNEVNQWAQEKLDIGFEVLS